jgi:glycosyltransferase involved in cell wall biosynthesis
MKPIISVIVSTFNRSNLLKRAIQSVLNQSFKDFELIVVDDCSTDNTHEVVKSFNDDRIKYVKTEQNSGHDGLPKNLGILKAEGDYISFLDDDDVYRRDALKVLCNYIKVSKADVVYGDYLMHEKGKTSPSWSIDFNASFLSRRNYIAMSVVMAKKSALVEVGGFNEEVPKFKDWNLWIRLQKNTCRFLHIPIIVTEVYMQDECVSGKYKVEFDEQGNYLPTFFNPADCKIYADKTILGERKPLKVAVYSLIMDRLDYTLKMIEAMNRTAGYEFDYFVIEQNSSDGTKEFLKGQSWIKKIKWNEKNTGVAKGWNQAIELIRSTGHYDIYVKLDNDALMLTDGWLKAMVELFERNKGIILSPYVEGLEHSPGGVIRQRQTGESPYVQINEKVLGIVPNLGGICFATPKEVYDGWKFDESLQMMGNKDYALSCDARKRGYTLFYMEEYIVEHQDGTMGQHQKYPEYFKETLKLKSRKLKY